MATPIAPSALDALRAHARAAHPDEAVGALFGRIRPDGGPEVLRYEALTNVAPAPRTSFAVDGVELAAADGRARDAGLRLLGLCHTHPDGRPTPSAADEAADWPGASCWIAATDGGDRFTLAEFELRSARLQGPGRAEPDQKRNV